MWSSYGQVITRFNIKKKTQIVYFILVFQHNTNTHIRISFFNNLKLMRKSWGVDATKLLALAAQTNMEIVVDEKSIEIHKMFQEYEDCERTEDIKKNLPLDKFSKVKKNK